MKHNLSNNNRAVNINNKILGIFFKTRVESMEFCENLNIFFITLEKIDALLALTHWNNFP
jgi:hypothetical protein